jgi:hypothetical protein
MALLASGKARKGGSEEGKGQGRKTRAFLAKRKTPCQTTETLAHWCMQDVERKRRDMDERNRFGRFYYR